MVKLKKIMSSLKMKVKRLEEQYGERITLLEFEVQELREKVGSDNNGELKIIDISDDDLPF